MGFLRRSWYLFSGGFIWCGCRSPTGTGSAARAFPGDRPFLVNVGRILVFPHRWAVAELYCHGPTPPPPAIGAYAQKQVHAYKIRGHQSPCASCGCLV